jgi:hypothetical protein
MIKVVVVIKVTVNYVIRSWLSGNKRRATAHFLDMSYLRTPATAATAVGAPPATCSQISLNADVAVPQCWSSKATVQHAMLLYTEYLLYNPPPEIILPPEIFGMR